MKKTIVLVSILFWGYTIFGQEANHPSDAQIPQEIRDKDQLFDQLYQLKEGDLNRLKGTGYLPYQRDRYFYEQRRQFDGSSSVDNRWDQFVALQAFGGESSGPTANWESIGPTEMDGHGGRIISHAFDPLVEDVLWVGSATGGLWLTENAGESWTSMTDNIPSTGVGAVAIHPQDSDILVIGTGEGYSPPGISIKGGIGTFKSIDRGSTWLPTNFNYPVAAGVSVLKLSWHPSNFKVIWMAATNGLWKSEDMGDTWNLILGDGSNHQSFIFDDIIIQQNNPDIIFVSREGFGIFKSTNGGANFTQLGGGLPTSDLNFISMEQCTAQPDVLYASITKASDFSLMGVYKSTNNGSNWTQLGNTPNAFCVTNVLGTFCQGWYNNTISVSPVDPDLVFFGGITFWRSDDGGVNWEQKDRSICANCGDTPTCATYVDHHDFGFDPHDPTRCFSFNDGGVSRSADSGDCWESANQGLVTAQYYAIASGRSNPDIVSGGLQDHGLFAANIANGLNWERWGFFDGADVEVDPVSSNRLYGTWINGSYWRSLNGTNTFATQITNGINLNENSGAHFAPIRMHPTDPTILLGSTQQGIYRTENSGASWQKNHNANVVTDLAFSQASPNICYAASWNGGSWFFHRSEDSGITWTITNNSPGWRVTDIKTSGTNPNVVFASRNSINPNTPHIYKSMDRGDNWIPIQGDLPDITVNAIAVNFADDEVIYAATDFGVYITIDGGTTWTPFNENFPISYVFDIEYNPTDHKLRAATHGRGVWISDAFGDPLGIEDRALGSSFDFVVFPNPTEGEFTIAMSPGNREELVEVSILNFLGQTIAILGEDALVATDQGLQWSVTDTMRQQSNGIYFVKVRTSNFTHTRKLLLSK
ncbi:MAG: T9SS type A sorting domain-containing protein [Bacteroidota bacterium]